MVSGKPFMRAATGKPGGHFFEDIYKRFAFFSMSLWRRHCLRYDFDFLTAAQSNHTTIPRY